MYACMSGHLRTLRHPIFVLFLVHHDSVSSGMKTENVSILLLFDTSFYVSFFSTGINFNFFHITVNLNSFCYSCSILFYLPVHSSLNNLIS